MNWKALSVSLLLAIPAFAGDDFKSANALFDAGKFAEAIAVYEKIEPKSAHVLFNLGNAQYRAGQLGRAVVSYERARRLAQGDPDTLANLQFAEEQLGVAEVNLPAKPHARFWKLLTGSRTIGQWARYEVAGVWLTVVLVAGAIWLPRLRTGCVIFVVVAGGWLIMTLAILVCLTTAPPDAIVLTGRTEARFAPLVDATVHFQLGEGTKVGIREDRGQWWLVERADGQQGWIKSEAAERVILRMQF